MQLLTKCKLFIEKKHDFTKIHDDPVPDESKSPVHQGESVNPVFTDKRERKQTKAFDRFCLDSFDSKWNLIRFLLLFFARKFGANVYRGGLFFRY